MDYKEHFAHLLEHLEGRLPDRCEKPCEIYRTEHGGISVMEHRPEDWPEVLNDGPLVTVLLDALVLMGFAICARIGDGVVHRDRVYYPTPLGIDFRENYRQPRRFWVKKKWFPVAIVVVTTLVALTGILIDILKTFV